MTSTVVIAGGGPTGLMLAGELRLAGVDAVVVESRAQPAERSAGMAIHGRALELFKQRGLFERIKEGEIFPWPRTPFSMIWLNMEGAAASDHTYAFPQWRTERLLEDRARELGADIRRGWEVSGFDQDATGVRVRIRPSSGGDAEEISGDYLVGCDGAESVVRAVAGIGFPASGDGYCGVFGDMVITGEQPEFDHGVHQNGVFGAIPINAETLRLMTLEFDVERPSDEVAVTEEELAARIERITGREVELGPMRWMSRFGAPVRLAERYRDGRVFLAGDAAHSLFISGTQGLNAGLQDATNLGWKLAATLNGWAPEDLLDSYEAERRPVGERICWHAQAAMNLLHPLDRLDQLRLLIGRLMSFEEANRHMLRITTEARYPMGQDGADETVHPLLGQPVPDAGLVTGNGVNSVAQPLRTGRGVLLDLSNGTADLEGLSGWADRVDVVTAEPLPELDAAVVLVRPDGHVALADPADADPDRLRQTLRTWFGAPAPRS